MRGTNGRAVAGGVAVPLPSQPNKHRSFTVEFKVGVVEWVELHDSSVRAAAVHFGLDRKVVRAWIRQKQALRRQDKSQKDIKELISRSKVICLGATTDPSRRVACCQRQGYSGTITFARTHNMRCGEVRLLKLCRQQGNKDLQRSTDLKEESGFVYIITES